MNDRSATKAGSPIQARISKLVIGLLSVLGVVCLLCLLTYAYGNVRGEEFCPITMQRRTFSYYEIPLIHVQISPIRRQPHSNPMRGFLRRSGYAAPSAGPRWDLVWFRSSSGSKTGDATILCRYLDVKDPQGKPYWEQWSTQHPEQADLLWTYVVELAHRRMYLLIPDLFEAAQSSEDAATFQETVNQKMAQRFLELALAQQELGDHELAIQLFGESLKYVPARPEVLRGRASSYRATAKTDEAAVDERAADALESDSQHQSQTPS